MSLIKSRGSIIGYYRNRPIYDLIDENYLFSRIAYEDNGGHVPLEQLSEDEVVISPGLIYKKSY
jgi:hypothetical protein